MSPKITEEQKESKRAEILEAATRVFIRKGYQAATMKDVVEESGLSRGGVYLYFGSTEEMLLAIVESMDLENEMEFTEAIEAAGSVWKAILLLFGSAQQEAERSKESMLPVLLEFFSIEWRSGRFTALMQSRYAKALEFLEAFIREGVKRGEFHPVVPPEAIARIIVSFNDGLYIGATQIGHEYADTRMQLDTMVEVLRHLLQVDGKQEVRQA